MFNTDKGEYYWLIRSAILSLVLVVLGATLYELSYEKLGVFFLLVGIAIQIAVPTYMSYLDSKKEKEEEEHHHTVEFRDGENELSTEESERREFRRKQELHNLDVLGIQLRNDRWL